MKRPAIAGAVLAALALPLHAQTQQVKSPIASYCVSVETSSDIGGIAMPPGMTGALPPGMQGGKRMKLELGSSGMTMLAETDFDGGRARGRVERELPDDQPERRAAPQQPASPPGAADAVKEGVNILRGIFGR